jgi:hypothetical protein
MFKFLIFVALSYYHGLQDGDTGPGKHHLYSVIVAKKEMMMNTSFFFGRVSCISCGKDIFIIIKKSPFPFQACPTAPCPPSACPPATSTTVMYGS